MVEETEGSRNRTVRYNTMPRHCRGHQSPIRVVDVYYGGFAVREVSFAGGQQGG